MQTDTLFFMDFYFGEERLSRFQIRERLRLVYETKEKNSSPNYSITFRDILSKIKYIKNINGKELIHWSLLKM